MQSYSEQYKNKNVELKWAEVTFRKKKKKAAVEVETWTLRYQNKRTNRSTSGGGYGGDEATA